MRLSCEFRRHCIKSRILYALCDTSDDIRSKRIDRETASTVFSCLENGIPSEQVEVENRMSHMCGAEEKVRREAATLRPLRATRPRVQKPINAGACQIDEYSRKKCHAESSNIHWVSLVHKQRGKAHHCGELSDSCSVRLPGGRPEFSRPSTYWQALRTESSG